MSVKERLQSGDWSGKTAKEIAEELGCSVDAVYLAQKQIKAETGEEVPYRKMHQKTKVNTGKRNVGLKEALLEGDWSDLTATEIAETLGTDATTVYTALYRLKKNGREVPYKKQSRGRPKKADTAEATQETDTAASLSKKSNNWTTGGPVNTPEPGQEPGRKAKEFATFGDACVAGFQAAAGETDPAYHLAKQAGERAAEAMNDLLAATNHPEDEETLTAAEPEWTKLPKGAAILADDHIVDINKMAEQAEDGERANNVRPYEEAETPEENPESEEGISKMEITTEEQEACYVPDFSASGVTCEEAAAGALLAEAMRNANTATLEEPNTAATVSEMETVGRAECLSRARECVCGERETDYGSPEDNFAKIAALWSAYRGEDYTAQDVAVMMALLKIARIGGGRATVDSWVDLAGYAACGCEITTRRQEAGA